MAEGLGLPEGATEASGLNKELREAKTNLSRIADAAGTLVVIVVAGVILKLLDFTSAKETELNDKAHSYAATAITAQLQFAEAANEQKVAAQTLERALLNGQDVNIVSRLLTTYDSRFSSYQLKNYDLIRLSNDGDIRHFLAGPGDIGSVFGRFGVFEKVGLHPAVSPEMSVLQGVVAGPLGPAGRHHDCLQELAERYESAPDQAKAALAQPRPIGADGKPVGIVCKDRHDSGRLYVLDDELTSLDACETQVERHIYGLADKLMIDGWLKVGADVNQSPAKLPKGYLWTSAKPCTPKALSGTAPNGSVAIIDRLPHTDVPPAPVPPPLAPEPAGSGVMSAPAAP